MKDAMLARNPGQRCADDFTHRRWEAALGSCNEAFEAAPDATSALRIAHAYWSRGYGKRAAGWASTAVELGTRDADAFVLIGHGQRRAGQVKDAMRAYRRYLRWSPHGWHARNVRRALRELKLKVLAQSG
jgi:Flp pilus assembly protein TadD